MAPFPQYIDTHSHLNHEEFGEAWQTVIPNALESEVWMILVGHDYCSSVRAIEIAREFPYGVYAAVGFHPSHIARHEISPLEFGLDAFVELLGQPKVVAVGEIGLDLRHSEDDLEREYCLHKQGEALRGFLLMADRARLPVILHAHGAEKEMLDFLRDQDAVGALGRRGVRHHFIGNRDNFDAYHSLDVLPSITGLAARSYTMHNLLQSLPEDQLLIESECIHLVPDACGAPRPMPAHLPGAMDAVSVARGLPAEAIRRSSTKNALRIFSKIVRTLP